MNKLLVTNAGGHSSYLTPSKMWAITEGTTTGLDPVAARDPPTSWKASGFQQSW